MVRISLRTSCVVGTLLYTVLALASGLDKQTLSVKIGGIFNTPLEERVFRFTVDFISQNNIIGDGLTLEYIVNKTNYIDTFENIQLACAQAEAGIVTLIGPISSTSVKAVTPVTGAFHIPHIAPAATNPLLGNKKEFPFLVRMMPPDSVQSLALVDLVEHFHWTKMAILTSDTDYGVNGLIAFQSEATKRGWSVFSVQRFRAAGQANETHATAQLQIIKDTGVRVIILNCLAFLSVEVMRQAKDLQMTGPGWSWIVTDGTTGTNDLLEPSILTHVEGLLGTIPAVGQGELYDQFEQGWNETRVEEGNIWPALDAYSALVADAVLTFAFAARAMYRDLGLEAFSMVDTPSCQDPSNSTEAWSQGRTLLQYITDVKENGVASYIEFNSMAAPLRPSFDIVNLKSVGWVKVGNWTPQMHLSMVSDPPVVFMGGQRVVLDYISNLATRTLSVVTIEEKPFVNLLTEDYDPNNLKAADIEGYCIDLLNMLSNITGFEYNLYLVEDGAFGIKDPETGQWNGLVNDLVIRKADLAAADFTVSYSREKDIDFTNPFLDLGMTFVLKKPETPPPSPFRFLEPLTPEVWMYMLLTALIVGTMISFYNKLSPYDYHGGFVYCANDVLEKEALSTSYAEWKKFKRRKQQNLNKLSLMNSVWFSVASLLSQGGEYYPRSLSGRVIGVLWWLAVVILVSTYTANLAAFLTSSRTKSYIKSVEDLAAQSKILYGTTEKSAPHQFFLDSTITLYQDMKALMNVRETYVKNTADGIEKVRNEDFAFIWDSAVLEYIVEEQPCDLRTVGRIFGKLGYGFGLQKNSPYTQELSSLILLLRETGYMDELKHKWFVERGQCSAGAGSSGTDDQVAAAGGKILVSHMLGVFYIIYGAISLSVVLLVAEWFLYCYRAVDPNDPYMPHTLSESMRKHLRLFKKDLIQDCLPKLPSIGHLRRVEWGKGSVRRVRTQSSANGQDNSAYAAPDVNFRMAKYVGSPVESSEISNREHAGSETAELSHFDGLRLKVQEKKNGFVGFHDIPESPIPTDARWSYGSAEKLWF